MKQFQLVMLAALLGVQVISAAAVQAQDAAAKRGLVKFNHSCAPCHGKGPGNDGKKMLPGTDSLRLKYQGSLPPALEDRKDLTADAIKTFVRQGSSAMPPFRKTELTDAEIVDIAAYLKYASSHP
jgi:mono/diheme cytochrome c family protein